MHENDIEMIEDFEIQDLPETIEVRIPKNMDHMDFADRMEYLWNLAED